MKLVITGGTLDVVDPTPLPPPSHPGTLVPLYTRPSDTSWDLVIVAKRAAPSVPVLAIVNPANGPGSVPMSSYTTGISGLAANGVRPLGYVATGYGQRAEALIRTDIDRWRSFYPAVTGLFLDEFGGAGREDFYRGLVTYARARGVTLLVGNPGSGVSSSYAGVVDVLNISEGAGLPDLDKRLASWPTPRDPSKFAALAYGVPLFDAAWIARARLQVGYIYVTSDGLPNPWDSLSPYFAALMAALA